MPFARARVTVFLVACSLPVACDSGGARNALPPGVTTTPPVDRATTTTTIVDSGGPTSTLAPDGSTTTAPTVNTLTSAPPSTDASDEVDPETLFGTATPVVPDDALCEIGWSPLTSTTGEVTFARDGEVFSFDPESGELHCLARVDRDPARLDWNPAGDVLLVDEDLVVSARDQHPSGFAPGTAGLSWSQPTGTALIAPSADGSSLRHVDASDPDDETDVGALATTWSAAYHPSGLAIVSAGVDSEGIAGLFIADNAGNGARNVVFLEDRATTITDVAFAHNGNWVTFVHDHTDGTIDEGVTAHIHRLHLPDLRLEDIVSLPDVVPTGLVASEQLDGSIAWQEEYSSADVQAFAWSGAEPANLRFEDTTAEPVGFFDAGTAAVVVRPVGAAEADAGKVGQLWVYPVGGDPILIARGVSAATTRTVHHPVWSDPPLRIDEAAVG